MSRAIHWWQRCTVLIGMVFLATLSLAARAHEVRPAYLEITEKSPEHYEVLWRTPVLAGQRLPVLLRLPSEARNLTEPFERNLNDSFIEKRVVEVPGGLAGKRIEFVGLQATITDVLVRVQGQGGETRATMLIQPSQAGVDIPAKSDSLAVAGAFLKHGVEHILSGYDHLLFVLALILLVRNVRMLLLTVTAFTLAHSITLALATLGVLHVPSKPTEALIALSILLLACEIVRMTRGEPSLTGRYPWSVAFAFGLLHGLGFAGALSGIGLPASDVPLALFAFNVGVELGQLAFIATVLMAGFLLSRVTQHFLARRRLVVGVAYGIGSVSAFWFFERLAGF